MDFTSIRVRLNSDSKKVKGLNYDGDVSTLLREIDRLNEEVQQLRSKSDNTDKLKALEKALASVGYVQMPIGSVNGARYRIILDGVFDK